MPVGGGKPMISHSLLDRTIRFSDSAERAKDGMIWGHADGPDQQHLRVLSRRIEFPITATARPDDSRAYMFTVASDMSEVDRRIAEFNGTLIWSFVVLGLGLIAAVFIQVRVGLAAAAPGDRCAAAHPRRQGAAARRPVSRRDRTAWRASSTA